MVSMGGPFQYHEKVMCLLLTIEIQSLWQAQDLILIHVDSIGKNIREIFLETISSQKIISI